MVTITDANGCSISTSSTVLQPTQSSVTTSVTNVSVLTLVMGSATANPTGGVGPYTYNWGGAGTNQTITNPQAGTFFVTVTDANLCTATAFALINQPTTTVMVTATQTRFACWGERW